MALSNILAKGGTPPQALDVKADVSFQPGEGPLAILNTDALSRGGTVASYVDELGSYAASLPIASPSGETICPSWVSVVMTRWCHCAMPSHSEKNAE